MTPHELRQLREEMCYSMADMSKLLGVPKSTYARYEDGTAKMSPELAERVVEEHRLDREWMSSMMSKINQDLTAKFPFGIVSAGESL